MRGGRVFVLLGLVLIALVVLAAIFLPQLLQPSKPTSAQQTVVLTPITEEKVIIVTQRVPRGTILNETVLGTVTIPKDLMIPGMFTDMAAVVGRKAKFDMDAGILLNSNMLVDIIGLLAETGSNWALAIPPGKVAISIPISKLSAVSYAPRRGDHVDVIATFLMVDLDTDFQTLLPNGAAQGVYPPFGAEGYTTKSKSTNDIATGRAMTGEIEALGRNNNLVGQIVGPSMGKVIIDPVLGHPFYQVPNTSDISPTGTNQRPRLVSQTILKNVVILRVGNFPTEEEEAQKVSLQPQTSPTPLGTPPAPGVQPIAPIQPGPQQGGQAAQTPLPPPPPDVITLIVSPQDAISINYLLFANVPLTMVLRSAGDEATSSTEAVTLQYLLDHYNIPVPDKLPYGMAPRQDTLAPTLAPQYTPQP
jgi:Flp pilus assembly protein CpaB